MLLVLMIFGIAGAMLAVTRLRLCGLKLDAVQDDIDSSSAGEEDAFLSSDEHETLVIVSDDDNVGGGGGGGDVKETELVGVSF